MKKLFWGTALLLFLIGGYVHATVYNAPFTVSGLFTASGHTVLEGVTSTGATGTGKLAYDTSPIFTTPNIGSAAANAVNYCADAAGSGTTYTCTVTGLTAYTTGMLATFVPGTASSGASTINMTSLGAKSIIFANTTGTAMGTNDLLAGGVYQLEYDGTNFRKISGPDQAWTGLSYSNSWTDIGAGFQAGQYRKLQNGQACVRGTLSGGTQTAGTTVFTLPAGARPPAIAMLMATNDAATKDLTVQFRVTTGGVATLNSASLSTYIGIPEQCFAIF